MILPLTLTTSQILFGQHPFRGIKNDFMLFRAIAEGQSPWVWDETVPVERTLSRCCQLEQKSRPSIENVLEELCLVQAPTSETQIEGESSPSSSEPQIEGMENASMPAYPRPVAPGAMAYAPRIRYREPNPVMTYGPFLPFYIVRHMDEFLEILPEVPPLPAALVSHDVTHDDWARYMSVSHL